MFIFSVNRVFIYLFILTIHTYDDENQIQARHRCLQSCTAFDVFINIKHLLT